MHKMYAQFRRSLPREFFQPYWPTALLFVGLFVTAVTSLVAIATLGLPWWANLGLSLVVGYCWAIGGLMGHEIMHGSVIRSKTGQYILGFFCFLPFLISPTFWRYWHNNLHHSHTQRTLQDPDAYPTLRVFKQSKFTQWMFPFSPGSGYKRSYFYFFFWFSFNAQVAQHYLRFRNNNFAKLNHKMVNRELALALAIHGTALFFIPPSLWLFTTLIPLAVMNYLPFSYISTNHNLSPLTKENDPLVNSLTVTNHPLLEFLHIHFGYHVEHHLFPTVNGVYLKHIHKKLKVEYPEKYQFMPKWQAMIQLYKTPRIYKNSTTLVHPETGVTARTIGAENASPKKKVTISTPVVEPAPVMAAQNPQGPGPSL